ncbi:MAG: tetratricopeptide repeat protein [Pyrinomonadaceae bacterium]
MPIEAAISEEFEQYDDEKEFRRLIRAVRFAQKHYLYFACCNQVPKQNALIADVKKSLKGKTIKVVKFKKPVADLLGELQKKVIGANCEAVFVQGLEYSISSDGKGAENALIHNLNISRDSFKKYLSCPLFLWLPEYALVKITRHAPDFFSVRSGTFYFSNPPEKVTEQIFQSVSSSLDECSSLPLAEKLKQIETLENLLAEYRGLHKEKQDKQAEIILLSKLAFFFDFISEYRKALGYHEQSLAISREIGNRLEEGKSLNSIGNAYYSLGEYRKAIGYHEQSLAISREIGNRLEEGKSLSNIGNSYLSLGDYKKPIIYNEEALAISREIEDRSGEGNSYGNLGNAYYSLGNYERSIAYYEQHLAISRETGNRSGESINLSNLGNAYLSLGNYLKAIGYYEQALEIKRAIGDLSGEGISLGNLGIAYDKLGDYRKAIDYYEQALTMKRASGNRLGEGISLGNLGSIFASLGEREKGCRLWKEALAILQVIESPHANNYQQMIEKNCQN